MSASLFMVCAKFDQRQASPIKMSGVLVAATMGKSPLIALQRSIKWEIVFFLNLIIYFLYTFFRELLLQHREGRDGISYDKVLKLSQNDHLFYFAYRKLSSSKSNLQNTCTFHYQAKAD